MSDPLRIVLVSSRNPLNMGAAARAMSNFGFTDLRVVNPYDAAFQEARSAVRSHYILEQTLTSAAVLPKLSKAQRWWWGLLHLETAICMFRCTGWRRAHNCSAGI